MGVRGGKDIPTKGPDKKIKKKGGYLNTHLGGWWNGREEDVQ